jgi:TRAP transporter TAXI family solute receptor
MVRACAVGFLVAAFCFAMPDRARSVESKHVTIGTGGVTGVYYPAGGAICRLVNNSRERHGIRCSVESTAGSVANLAGIEEGTLEFGLVQSDWQYYAYSGGPPFTGRVPIAGLRSVFSLHVEPFTVVARAGSGIRSFFDLKGKRVNIGNPGSGQRGTMEVVMSSIGWTIEDFAVATELSADEQSQALCGNRIDAMIFVAGHPSASVKEATATCASLLVEADLLEKLKRKGPFYRKVTIPGGMYAGNDKDIPTFGVFATLVTSDRMAEETVYELVRTIFDNFAAFKKQHPAFKELKMRDMVRAGLTAPLHPGALRYYKEAGWH